MKKALIYVSVFLALFYLVGSFMFASFNISLWSYEGRLTLGGFALFVSIIVISVTLAENVDGAKK